MKTVCSVLLLLYSSITFAQRFAVSVSDEMKYEGATPTKMGDNYFALVTDTKMQFGFTFKLNKIKYSIKLSKYDKSLNLVKEISLSNGERVYGPFVPVLKKLNDKLYVIYYQPTEEDNRIKLFASEIDLSDLSLKTPNELLTIEQKNVALQQVMDLMSSNKLVVASLPDQSKVVAFWGSGINNRLFISVLDKELKKIRETEMIIKGENQASINNGFVDNGGNVFISCAGRKDTHIVMDGADGRKLQQTIKLDGASLHQAFIMRSANGSNGVQVVGTYKEGSDWLAGVFSQTIDIAELQAGATVKTAFPPVLVERFENDGWANKKPKKFGLSQITLQPFALADGSVDLVGEFRRTEMGMRTSFEVAGSILNIHFQKDGPVFSRIPKARVSAGSTIGDSYGAFPSENGMVIFYNDHETNTRQDINASPSRSDNYKNDVLVAATLAKDGTVKREILIDLSQQNFLPVAEQVQALSSSSVIVPVRRIKGFGKVSEDFKWGLITIQ